MIRVLASAVALTALFTTASFGQAPATATPPATPPAATPPAMTPAPAPAPSPAPAAAPTPAATAASSGNMEGLAAYYSDKLNGHKTASGQVLDQHALTAAHPTLPFGTKVKVTNTKNNRSVIVRINDRGPTQSGRVIDVTRAAATKLGMSKNGTVPVKLEVVAEAPAKKSK
jgi:rare lipoprotein A